MATKEKIEITENLKLALDEVGTIKPWFDKEFQTWIFFHDLYPVECSGDTEKEVIENYPLYLKEFIKYRLEDRLAPVIEKKTKGHGGKRIGSGRPKKSDEEKNIRVYLPKDVALWIKSPGMIQNIRQMVAVYKNSSSEELPKKYEIIERQGKVRVKTQKHIRRRIRSTQATK